MAGKSTILRILIHGLLAVFLANAANKFFVADLEYEALNGFYDKIFAFEGQAPDQYRILPLLGIKSLIQLGGLSFNYAVLLFNAGISFLLFELLWMLSPGKEPRKKYLLSFFYALVYTYLQYTGWRPDTQGLVLLCALLSVWVWKWGNKDGSWMITCLLLALLAFSRAEIALIFALFIAWTYTKNWAIRVLFVAIPVAVQLLLQVVIFSEALYYTKALMITDNLSLYYFLRNPATYALIAAVLIWFPEIKNEAKRLWKDYPLFILLCIGYLALVFVVGRINEYRLYLPFVPLYMLTLHRGSSGNGEKISGI